MSEYAMNTLLDQMLEIHSLIRKVVKLTRFNAVERTVKTILKIANDKHIAEIVDSDSDVELRR